MLTSDPSPAPVSGHGAARGGVAVLEKAMATVNLVARAPHPLTFTDLQRASGLPKATLHRLLATLVREGLVRFESKDRSYRLGLRLLELAHRVWADFDLRVAAADELAQQAQATGETIELCVLSDDHVVVVASETPGQTPGAAAATGDRRPLHASAPGKCIVAYVEATAQRHLLDRLTLRQHTTGTLTSVAALRADLDLAHARGYALEDEELRDGTRGIAVPILDHAGLPIGALGLSGPASRLTLPRLHGFASRLIGAARRISHDAGGSSMSLTPTPRPPIAPAMPVDCVAEVRSLLGEGPTWDAARARAALGRHPEAGAAPVRSRHRDRCRAAHGRDDQRRVAARARRPHRRAP